VILALARKRLLNVPYLIVIVNIVSWIGRSFVYKILGFPNALTVSISSGLITVVLAFFWVEHVIIWFPCFFPMGICPESRGKNQSAFE
jgi:adenylate cyclase